MGDLDIDRAKGCLRDGDHAHSKEGGLAETCALITNGRYSGATSGLSVGHMSPEAAAGGGIALIEEGDTITIEIPGRAIRVEVDEEVLDARAHRDGRARQSVATGGAPQARDLKGAAGLCALCLQRRQGAASGRYGP